MRYHSFLYTAGLFVFPFIFVLQSEFQASLAYSASGTPALPETADCSSAKGLVRVICLADAFKATLTNSQVAQLQVSYSKTDAVK